MVVDGKENIHPNSSQIHESKKNLSTKKKSINNSGISQKKQSNVQRPLLFSEILFNNDNSNQLVVNCSNSTIAITAPITMSTQQSVNMNGLFNPGFIAPTPNVFGAIGSQASSSNSSGSGNSDHMDPFLWLGPIGSSLPSSNNYSPPSNDEYTNGIPYLPETQSLGNICGNCDRSSPENHCFDCSDSLCNRCVIIHLRNLSFKQHTIQKIQNSSPTLTGRILNNYPTPPQSRIELENQCDMHFEVMRCVCDNCKILVCQECTLRDHKDHQYTPIEKYIERPQSIIQLLMDKGGIGKQQIKQNIDRILQFSQHLERDTNEIIQRSRKNGLRIGALSTIHQGIRNEEQERTIIDMIEKFRQQKITNFHDQTSGLRTALAGIASVTDDLKKLSHSFNDMNHYQLAKQLIESDHKIEHFLKQTRKLSPTSVNVNQFVQSIDLSTGIPTTAEDNFIGELQRLMQRTKTSHSNTAHSITSNTNISNLSSALIPSTSVAALATINGTNSPSMLPPTNNITNNITNNNNNINGNRSIRRPITRNNRTYQNNNQTMQTGLPTLVGITWNNTQNLMNGSEMQLFTLPAQTFAGGANRVSPEPRAYGQCIFNSDTRVSIVQREHPSHSFAYDGSLDGQLSRPWGVCVDKDGNIIIGDRRNNRIQIFYPDGSFKFAFGTKGTGDGQLELPAGVTTDRQNRIIVADKDNHRIQIFSSTGRFILKFGSYGRDLGEFQYPWDVAVNSVGNIIATDTRNHRIQMFTSNGHYLTKFSFDNAYYEKHLKSHITPRGVAFAPDGDILVTDFENHRIMKLDSSLSMVKIIRGREGDGEVHEFNRPSGLSCDDNGRIVIADSKNQRVLVYNTNLDFQWVLDVRRTLSPTNSEKDRPSDVAILPDGRIVVLFETSPDTKDSPNPLKTFVQIY